MRGGYVLVTGALSVALACGGASKPTSDPTPVAGPAVQDTLYQRIGGIDVLRRLVDSWILEAASDPRIRDFFGNADIARLKLRMVERLCVLVEGPCMYKGAELREHHAAVGIEERHMRAFLDDLDPAMERAEIVGDAAQELREAIQILGVQIGTAIGE